MFPPIFHIFRPELPNVLYDISHFICVFILSSFYLIGKDILFVMPKLRMLLFNGIHHQSMMSHLLIFLSFHASVCDIPQYIFFVNQAFLYF